MFERILSEALSGGYVPALGLVCLVQYAYHVHQMSRARRAHERVCEEFADLEREMEGTLEDALLARFETEFLRQFVAQTKLDHALSVLLEHLVPDATTGFAGLFLFQDGRPRIHRSRGLDPVARRTLRIDRDSLRDVVAHGQAVVERAAARLVPPAASRSTATVAACCPPTLQQHALTT